MLFSSAGHYLYIETSDVWPGYKARISKKYENVGPTGNCLSFWSHMWGAGIGTLNVYIDPPKDMSQATPVWSRSGEQGNFWFNGRYRFMNKNNVTVSSFSS